MNDSNSVIDLTQSFSLAKVDFTITTDVIELIDTDESFDSSISIVIEQNSTEHGSKSKKASRKKEDYRQAVIKKRSKKESGNGRESRSYNGFGDCPICWDRLGKNPLASTKCGHVYCLKCLEQSLKIEKRCPTCRRVLKGTNAYHPLYINF